MKVVLARLALVALCASLALSPLVARSLSSVSASGAASATFASAANFSGVTLSTLRVGFGVDIAGDGSASGQFETTLSGTAANGEARQIAVSGKVHGGSTGSATTATISGTCTIDPGDGSAPTANVPFTASITAGAQGAGRVALTLGSSSLPLATVTDGSLTIR
jgi:hypothetical protein